MSLESELTLKLREEGLLDIHGRPNTSRVDYISGGSELYRYLGLANLIQNINVTNGNQLVCTPFSYKIRDIRIRWNSSELLKTPVFDEKLKECIQSPARFIVITVSLFLAHSGHANYILIDKGFLGNASPEFMAIRLEPHGFCNTAKQYNPTELDRQLKEYLRSISDGKIQLIDNEDDLTMRGLQSYEIAYRTDSCQLIPNQGLCATHSFLILDLFFKFATKKIPINFYWLKEGDRSNYVDITNNEGIKLFNDVFSALNMAILYPKDQAWIETVAVELNKEITDRNNFLLIQLAELLSIGRRGTRSGASTNRVIHSILHTVAQIPGDTCTEIWHDAVFITCFEYIINHTNLTQLELDNIFTIYGINYNALSEYAISYSTSLLGGKKTRRKKTRRKKTSRKKTRRKKTKKHKS